MLFWGTIDFRRKKTIYYGSQCCPRTALFPTFFRISSFVISRVSELVWNYLSGSKLWQNFLFWVNYPFKWLWTLEWFLVPDWLVWVFQKLLIYWDFHTQPSLGITKNGQKRKYPVSGSCVDENALLMSEVRGEWADFVRDDRKATLTQITTRYNQGMQNTISEHTTCWTLKQMGYCSRRPHQVLSTKNRKRRLQFTQALQNWTIEDWKNVAWSDESRFLMLGSEFCVRNMKAWFHPALSKQFRLVVVV